MYEQHIIIDFEMNPVSKKNREVRKELHKEIIEIGAVKLDKYNRIVDRFSCLVKPQYNDEIACFITKLTGIKTGSIKKAYEFEDAMKAFSEWIGEDKARIYSWSDADLYQLQTECAYKNINIPNNMKRWLDFQAIYPRVMQLDRKKKMSLSDAAQWFGVEVDKRKAHRALYDAEITAELVIPVLTGEYKNQLEILRGSEERHDSGFTIGDACGAIFLKFMDCDSRELQCAR